MIVRAEWPGYVMDVLVLLHLLAQALVLLEEVDEGLVLLEGTDSSHTPFYVSAPEAGRVREILVEEGDFAEEDDELVSLGESDSDVDVRRG